MLTWALHISHGSMELRPRQAVALIRGPDLMLQYLRWGHTLRCRICPCNGGTVHGIDTGRAFKLVDGQIWHQRDQGEWIPHPTDPYRYCNGWTNHEFEVE